MRIKLFIFAFSVVLLVAFGAVVLQLAETRSALKTTKTELGAVLRESEQLSRDLATTTAQLATRVAENKTLTANLETTTAQLTSKVAANKTLAANLQSTAAQLDTRVAENKTLTASLETTTAQLDTRVAENKTLTASLETTTAQLDTRVAENKTLTANLETTTAQLDTRVAENKTLAANLETTTAQLTSKTADYNTLVNTVGQLEEVRAKVATFQSQVTSLQSEIASLKAQRTPLIVESYTRGFKCTGSMEPKITCLDTATWLSNFRPQDVVVGAVISFTPTTVCNLSGSGPVAHRVTGIKMESGTYYYWTKGDANSQDDGCWIPQTNVNGYIIGLQKNTHPENQALREKVNSAKAAYEQRRLKYCGSLTGTCTIAEPYYTDLIFHRNAYLVAYNEALVS
ncbi:MAG: hypothetical protein HY672_02790 [Chloroflexi bacterium]|nr:hypothetical protein [Chloroflexota bacterium]